MTDKIQCRKCKRMVPREQKEMWKHALAFHPDTVLSKINERVEANREGTNGLFNIGFALGKQMQADKVELTDVIKNLAKGFTNANRQTRKR